MLTPKNLRRIRDVAETVAADPFARSLCDPVLIARLTSACDPWPLSKADLIHLESSLSDVLAEPAFRLVGCPLLRASACRAIADVIGVPPAEVEDMIAETADVRWLARDYGKDSPS